MKIYKIAQNSDISPEQMREWQIGDRQVYTIDGIEYMAPKTLGNDIMYSIPIAAVDAAWKPDRDFYIGSGDVGIAGRRDRFRDFLKKDIPIEAPEIYVDDMGMVTFSNGRHRFAEMRDSGKTSMAFAVSRSSNSIKLREMGAVRL